MSDSGNSSASEEFTVLLEGGRPWGFTLQGGADFRSPLKIGKITPNGRAQKAGLLGGDILTCINGVPTGQMKHHEAQRLITSSKTTLELVCMKGTQSVAFSPKSAISSDFNFDFPEGTTGPHQTKTLGHVRQRSLDLNYRPRSTSDASKRATAGNVIAGITVPKPPPVKTRRISEPHVALKQTEPAPVSTSEQPHYDTNKIEAAAELLQDVIGSLTANTTSQSEKPIEQETNASNMPESTVPDSQTQDIIELHQTQSTSPPQEDMIVVDKPESDVSTESSIVEKEEDSEGTSTAIDSEIFKGKDQDWYKSLFHNLKKGVDEDVPDKKPVWDRSPVPARKSSHDFQSKTSPNYKYKNTSYNAPTFQRRSSESSLPSPTHPKPLKQSCSGSSIGDTRPKPDVVSGASPGVVYQKNIRKFNQSRNYWKSIEKQASIERVELAAEAKRNSLRRSSSANSTGSGNSPDVVIVSSDEPGKSEDKSFFKEEVLEVFSSCITEEEPPSTVSPVNKVEDNSSANMAKLHPLLKDEMGGGEETVSDPQSQQNVFTRIDASKLNNAIGNAAVLGSMSQEGADPLTLQMAAISMNKSEPQKTEKAPVKKKKPKTASPPPGKKARVKFDFVAATEKELGLQKGVVVTLLEQVDANWLKGEYEGQTGIFPLSYVQVIDNLEEAEPQSVNQLAKAKHDFSATTDKELALIKGDIVTILKDRDENWYEASMGDSVGIVPKAYVEIIQLENELQ